MLIPFSLPSCAAQFWSGFNLFWKQVIKGDYIRKRSLLVLDFILLFNPAES